MFKPLILLILVLTLPNLKAQTTISTSDDSSSDATNDGLSDGSDLPAPPADIPTPPSAPATNCPPGMECSSRFASSSSASPQRDWRFIEGGSASQHTNSRWKTPQKTYKQHPYRWRTTYRLTFYTDCPQSPIYFVYATTAYSFVSINGQMIHSWGKPYHEYHNVTISQPHLKCGCNTIEVIVYNYCCPSPCGLTFSLSQDTSNCYNCNNTGVTYYNR